MSSDVEKAIMSHLSGSGMEKSRVSELAAIASRVVSADTKGLRILTKGTPVPDWVRLSAVVEKASASHFLSEILKIPAHLGGVSIFPYGIPFPDVYHVNVDLGPGAPSGH